MSRRDVVWLVVATCVAVTVVAIVGWNMFGRSSAKDDRFVRPGEPKSSPSGSYTALAESGPSQNGVGTWIVVVRDAAGAEVFRDGYPYSTRQGLGVTWLSTADQLWILSSDVGNAHVDRQPDGTWAKTPITPQTLATVPEEINRLTSKR